MKLNYIYVSVVFLAIFTIPEIQTAKILAIYPLRCRSTFMYHMKMMETLLDLGHELTVISRYPQHGRIANYTDIDVALADDIIEDVSDDVIEVDSYGSNALSELISHQQHTRNQLERLYANENIKKLLNSDQKFDLVFVEMELFFDHYLPMAFAFNAPVIGVYTYLVPFPDVDVIFGNVVNPSWLPSPVGGFSFKMNLIQRIRNFYYYVVHFALRLYADYSLNSVVRKSMPNSPVARELSQRISLIFDTSDPILSSRPMPSYMISVAGIHIGAPSTLPEDIGKFIADAKNGVIYASLGTKTRFSTLPAAQQDAFLKVFSSIPQRVLWKHDKPELVNSSSSNLLVKSWFPQSDILSNEKVKLFISHCGLFGLYEAIYHSVPILGMPIRFDQHMNCLLMEEAQLGTRLNYQEIDENLLQNAIQTILTTKRFTENMKIASDKFKDKPLPPTEMFAFWTDYIIRHKGPPHTNMVGQHLSAYEYLLLDVMAILIGITTIFVIAITFVTLSITRSLCHNRKKNKID